MAVKESFSEEANKQCCCSQRVSISESEELKKRATKKKTTCLKAQGHQTRSGGLLWRLGGWETGICPVQGPVLKSEQDTDPALGSLSTQADMDLRTGYHSPEGRCNNGGGTETLGD